MNTTIPEGRRQVPTREKLADEIIALLSNDMPDCAGHRRWLMTLAEEKLKERLGILREQTEEFGAAREIRIQSARWQRSGSYAVGR